MRALFVTVRLKPEYRDRILKGALEDGRGTMLAPSEADYRK
jgi:hypothetical protein